MEISRSNIRINASMAYPLEEELLPEQEEELLPAQDVHLEPYNQNRIEFERMIPDYESERVNILSRASQQNYSLAHIEEIRETGKMYIDNQIKSNDKEIITCARLTNVKLIVVVATYHTLLLCNLLKQYYDFMHIETLPHEIVSPYIITPVTIFTAVGFYKHLKYKSKYSQQQILDLHKANTMLQAIKLDSEIQDVLLFNTQKSIKKYDAGIIQELLKELLEEQTISQEEYDSIIHNYNSYYVKTSVTQIVKIMKRLKLEIVAENKKSRKYLIGTILNSVCGLFGASLSALVLNFYGELALCLETGFTGVVVFTGVYATQQYINAKKGVITQNISKKELTYKILLRLLNQLSEPSIPNSL